MSKDTYRTTMLLSQMGTIVFTVLLILLHCANWGLSLECSLVAGVYSVTQHIQTIPQKMLWSINLFRRAQSELNKGVSQFLKKWLGCISRHVSHFAIYHLGVGELTVIASKRCLYFEHQHFIRAKGFVLIVILILKMSTSLNCYSSYN